MAPAIQWSFVNSRVSQNEAGNDGGGIWIGGLDRATLGNTWVTRNYAGHDGGGIWYAGVLDFDDHRLIDNMAGNEGDDVFHT